MYKFNKSTALVFAIILSCLPEARPQENPVFEKPNILLIITDQLASSILSCEGNTSAKTPALDRLASTGVRFDKCYVSQPLCLPFWSSLQTGRYPHEIGAVVNQESIKGTFPMLGNLVSKAGYKCDYFGKWHVGTTPEAAGYKDYDNVGTDDKKAEAAVEYLQKNHEAPFFLTVSFMNPHNVCELARADADGTDLPDGSIGFPPSDLDQLPPLPLNFDIQEDAPSVIREEHKGSKFEYPTDDWDETTWRQYLWGYCRLVEKVDSETGKVLDALQKSGYTDNTVVIFTSDHGEGLAMQRWNQKKVFYDPVARVPLIINWKGKTQSRVYSELVSNALDIPATILDIAGIEKPASMHGHSLLPILEGGSPPSREFVACETMFNETSLGKGARGRMIRTGRYKYCVYSEGENREQLFDMENDPDERSNLACKKEYIEELKRHRKLASDWAGLTNDSEFPYFVP